MKLRQRQTGEEIELADDLILGRQADCGYVLADASVSRRHARIALREGQWWIEDLGSSNGTARNGQKQASFPLRGGDLISIGAVAFDVVDAARSPVPAAPETSLVAEEPDAAHPSESERQRARIRRELTQSAQRRGFGDLSQQPLWVQAMAVLVAVGALIGVATGVRWLSGQF